MRKIGTSRSRSGIDWEDRLDAYYATEGHPFYLKYGFDNDQWGRGYQYDGCEGSRIYIVTAKIDKNTRRITGFHCTSQVEPYSDCGGRPHTRDKNVDSWEQEAFLKAFEKVITDEPIQMEKDRKTYEELMAEKARREESRREAERKLAIAREEEKRLRKRDCMTW